MDEVISVIIPVYNVAAYLPACLDSLLNQDHKQLEVILIDDGSKDDSGAICDRYAAQDSRINVIHQKNGGAAAAKNAGLRAATGKYLSFVDSDDYLEPNSYGYMLSVLKSKEADVAVFGFRDVFRSRTEDKIPHPGKAALSGREYLVEFTKTWTCALLWNKLYKRSLFDGIFFEEGHKIDDEYFTYQGIMNAQKVVCDQRIIYNYRRRRGSAMLSPEAGSQRSLDRIDFLSKRRETVIRRFPELRKEFDIQYLDALTYLPDDPECSEESLRVMKQKLKEYLLQPGNTMPPKYLWRGLLRTAFTGTEKLLAQRRMPEMADVSEYFL